VVCSASAARANQIQNGGFEFPDIGNRFYVNYGLSTGQGGPDVPGNFDTHWNILQNNVDVFTPIVGWGAPAAEAKQVLDLVGYGATGEIAQTFNTVAGIQY